MKVVELNPDSVIIKERIREDFSEADIDRLAESIQQFGQLQPIGVKLDPNGVPVLIFGHRRLLACRKLRIPVKAVVLGQTSKVVDPALDDRLVEFIENAVRKDFTPAEKAKAVKDLHEALSAKEPDWTIEKTAKLLSLTRSYVSNLIRAAEALESGAIPPDTARTLTSRDLQVIASATGTAKEVLKAVARSSKSNRLYRILHGDAFKFKDLGVQEHSYTAIITDPPYGLEFQERTKTDKSAPTQFDDSAYYMSPEFLQKLWDLFDSLLTPEKGVVVCFCSLEQFFLHRQIAERKGFWTYPKPLIWIKSSVGIPFMGKYSPTSAYEVMVFAKRNKDTPIYKIGRGDWFNVPKPPAQERIHPTQKPEVLIQQIIESFCFPDYRIIDPFAGSGSTVLACVMAGVLEGTGIEINPETAKLAQKRLERYLAGREGRS